MPTTPFKVQKILKREKLIELKNISSNFHAYASICLNPKKEKVYLKVRLYPKVIPRKNFIKEVVLNKFLFQNFGSNRYFISPKYYASDISKWPEWLVREYTPGVRRGDTWSFGRDFYEKTSFREVADALDFIRGDISAKCRLKNKSRCARLFDHEGAKEYKKYFLKHFSSVRKYVSPKDQRKALKIFSRYRRLLAENNCLAHGDLHPGNVVCNYKKLVVHDWKYAHWDNPYLDFTFVWFLAWLDEKWRGDLFALEEKRTGDKDLFKAYFYLSILKLTPKMISILVQVSNISKKDFERGLKKHLSIFKEAINYLGSEISAIHTDH